MNEQELARGDVPSPADDGTMRQVPHVAKHASIIDFLTENNIDIKCGGFLEGLITLVQHVGTDKAKDAVEGGSRKTGGETVTVARSGRSLSLRIIRRGS